MTKPSNSLFLNDFRPNFLFRYFHQIFIRYFCRPFYIKRFSQKLSLGDINFVSCFISNCP